jgi:very-short-patch-repair endonuclease
MNGITLNGFIKSFPNTEYSEDFRITERDLLAIFKELDCCLNFNNPEIVNYLLSFGLKIAPKKDYKNHLKKLTNPNNIRGGSRRTKQFWTNRGYSEDEAKEIVSKLQSENSQRSIHYWIKRGYSEDEAKMRVSEAQTENARKFHEVAKKNGTSGLLTSFSVDYWVSKGLTKDEAISKVKNDQRERSIRGRDKYTGEERRRIKTLCLEYWLHKGKTVEDYENFMRRRRAFQSKSANKFFEKIIRLLPSSHVYYGNIEFGKYIKGLGYVKYDYVDLENKFVIEYDGVYWHRSDKTKAKDRIKQDFMEKEGFLFFRVTDIEDKENPELANELSEKIKCELLAKKQSESNRCMTSQSKMPSITF